MSGGAAAAVIISYISCECDMMKNDVMVCTVFKVLESLHSHTRGANKNNRDGRENAKTKGCPSFVVCVCALSIGQRVLNGLCWFKF